MAASELADSVNRACATFKLLSDMDRFLISCSAQRERERGWEGVAASEGWPRRGADLRGTRRFSLTLQALQLLIGELRDVYFTARHCRR
jgi:hypothetical protein